MSQRTLFPAVVAGLLAAVVSGADAPAPPAKARAEYTRVEIRGKLQLTDQFAGEALALPELFSQPVRAVVNGMPLAFKDKDQAERAKKLAGKTVLVSGDLSRVAGQQTAVQPTHYVYYVNVTALKAAD